MLNFEGSENRGALLLRKLLGLSLLALIPALQAAPALVPLAPGTGSLLILASLSRVRCWWSMRLTRPCHRRLSPK